MYFLITKVIFVDCRNFKNMYKKRYVLPFILLQWLAFFSLASLPLVLNKGLDTGNKIPRRILKITPIFVS